MARYLVTGEYVDPGPLLPPEQLVQMVEEMVLPSLEALAKLEERKFSAAVLSAAHGRAPSSWTWPPTLNSTSYFRDCRCGVS